MSDDGADETSTVSTARRLLDALAYPMVIGALVASVVLVVLAVVVVVTTSVGAEDFWKDVVGALLTVAGGLVITGVVGVMINRSRDAEALDRERAAEADAHAREQEAFVEAQVVKLWEIHQEAKRAAVLIATHQSAKTYGEELRRFIGLRTALSDAQGVVERRRHELDGFSFGPYREQLDAALTFLNPLIDEFTIGYRRVSALQSVDEIENKKRYATGDTSKLSIEAWKALNDATEFPQLQKVIAFGGLTAADYKDAAERYANMEFSLEFLDRIDLAAQLLRVRDTVSRTRADGRVAKHTARRQKAAAAR